LADLESVGSFGWRSAGTLSADVEEDGAGLVIEILIVDPISLSEVSLVREVEVVCLLSKVV
jgi:hypothetical protein